MTAKQAKGQGFTHHGKYFGIPVWIGGLEDSDGLLVAAKWAPLECLMSLFHGIEGLLRDIFFPDDEPCFQFLMGREIE